VHCSQLRRSAARPTYHAVGLDQICNRGVLKTDPLVDLCNIFNLYSVSEIYVIYHAVIYLEGLYFTSGGRGLASSFTRTTYECRYPQDACRNVHWRVKLPLPSPPLYPFLFPFPFPPNPKILLHGMSGGSPRSPAKNFILAHFEGKMAHPATTILIVLRQLNLKGVLEYHQ